MFFGSTTERVLRETSIPVLVTPDDRERVVSLSAMSAHVHRVIAPVDLTANSPHQVTVAACVASALSVPLTLAHVIEPAFIPLSVRLRVPGADAERRSTVEDQLTALADSAARGAVTESVVVTGEPSEEIVKSIAEDGARHRNCRFHSWRVVMKVAEIMSVPVLTCTPETSLAQAARLMQSTSFRHLSAEGMTVYAEIPSVRCRGSTLP